ncbi:hypothetical protein JG687_00015565 [Phytophthora cactorum]|uniref:Uncharacterized protein n=1 Tax=Phytophthora cactorum TaxID=29920 RepID=A0A329STT3_9STRA|nr:hypothetical protein PC123_g23194 [Phytophthora cactorum]KAG6948298.1 hypothetical protein JG687_00015565 [Phytophthora cactorum]RAW39871.1 hypothetical protein PC110_g3954 [Phytophthora cactorum]
MTQIARHLKQARSLQKAVTDGSTSDRRHKRKGCEASYCEAPIAEEAASTTITSSIAKPSPHATKVPSNSASENKPSSASAASDHANKPSKNTARRTNDVTSSPTTVHVVSKAEANVSTAMPTAAMCNTAATRALKTIPKPALKTKTNAAQTAKSSMRNTLGHDSDDDDNQPMRFTDDAGNRGSIQEQDNSEKV